MKRYWKIVAVVSAVLLVAGIVLGAAGYLTGASPDRIVSLVYGGWDGLRSMLTTLHSQLIALF